MRGLVLKKGRAPRLEEKLCGRVLEFRERRQDGRVPPAACRALPDPLLGFMVDFIAEMLSDLTVFRLLYASHILELWARGLQ